MNEMSQLRRSGSQSCDEPYMKPKVSRISLAKRATILRFPQHPHLRSTLYSIGVRSEAKGEQGKVTSIIVLLSSILPTIGD